MTLCNPIIFNACRSLHVISGTTHRAFRGNQRCQVIRSKIDIFTIEDERVEVTLDDDGLFLTACGKGAREDLSIGSKDLVIAVAKAILEHYNIPYTV